MRTSSLLLALVCTSVIAATAVSATQCAYGAYDFSPLTNSDLNYTDGTYDFFIRPCGVLSEPHCHATDEIASACQFYQPQNITTVTGIKAAPVWGLLPNNQGAFYNLTGDGNCWASGQPTAYHTNVEFVCASEYSLSVSTYQCTDTYTIETPLACSVPPEPSCGYESLDFFQLMGRDFVGSDGGSIYTYYMSVCGPLNNQPQCTAIDPTTSNCQVQVNPRGPSFDVGNWEHAEWFYIDDSNPKLGAGYRIMGARECWASGSPTYYISNVIFTCAESEGPLTVTNGGGTQSCLQNFTLPTPLACGPSKFEKRLPAIATE